MQSTSPCALVHAIAIKKHAYDSEKWGRWIYKTVTLTQHCVTNTQGLKSLKHGEGRHVACYIWQERILKLFLELKKSWIESFDQSSGLLNGLRYYRKVRKIRIYWEYLILGVILDTVSVILKGLFEQYRRKLYVMLMSFFLKISQWICLCMITLIPVLIQTNMIVCLKQKSNRFWIQPSRNS